MRNEILQSGVSMAKAVSEWSSYKHGRDLEAYALVYVEKGSGYFHDDLRPHEELRGGDVFLLFPGLRHHYGRRVQDELWAERWLVFDGPLFTHLEESGLLNRQEVILHTNNDSAFRDACAALVADHQNGDFYQDEHSGFARLHALIAEAYRLHRQVSGGQAWRERACALLSAPEYIEKKYAVVAAQMNVSPQVFRKKFSKEMGIAPTQFQLQRRLDTVQECLLH